MKLHLKIARVEMSYEVYDDEPEKLCHQCGECWPLDCFPLNSNGQPKSPCKACTADRRHETNTAEACCVPGCNQPRRRAKDGTASYSRCEAHERELWQARYKRSLERRDAICAAKTCCVEGCDQPRKHSRDGRTIFTRCDAHMREYWLKRWRGRKTAVKN